MLKYIQRSLEHWKSCALIFSPWLIFTRIFGVPLSQQLDFFGYINWLGNVICRILLILSLSFCSSPYCFCTLNAGIIFRRLNPKPWMASPKLSSLYIQDKTKPLDACLMDAAVYPATREHF